jgi:hypothetical protein
MAARQEQCTFCVVAVFYLEFQENSLITTLIKLHIFRFVITKYFRTLIFIYGVVSVSEILMYLIVDYKIRKYNNSYSPGGLIFISVLISM